MARILLIDDEDRLRDYLDKELKARGYAVVSLDSALKGIDRLEKSRFDFDVVVLDNMMPRMKGIQFLAEIRAREIEVPVVLMTGAHAFDTVVEARMLRGVEYVVKPVEPQDLLTKLESEIKAAVERAQESAGLPSLRLPQDPPDRSGKRRPVGRSELMVDVGVRLADYANSPHSVLICGESGTGKELVARAIHDFSQRKDKPFVPVNCAAININLAESEFFGHVKGAFTGADRDHEGYFEQADGGTLFLDEIGEMPLGLQVKLLRVLEEGQVQRVKGKELIKVDVRVLAATLRDLPGMIRDGTFRDDLYSRLYCFEIRLPPLRERLEDLPDLIHCFLEQEAVRTGRPRLEIAEATLTTLRAYHWPRNVRQLKHVIANAVALCQGSQILPQHIKLPADGAKPDALASCTPPATARAKPATVTEAEAVAGLHKAIAWALKSGGPNVWDQLHKLLGHELAKAAVEQCKGDKTAAAELLGASPNTVRKYLKEDDSKE